MTLKNLLSGLTVAAVAVMTLGNAHADTVTFQGGATNALMNLDVGSNWLASDGTTTGFPTAADTGIINVDSRLQGVSGGAALSAFGDLVFGGGSTLTATTDFVAANPTSVTFNNVTVNAGDDIFTGGATGNFIFNVGSVTNVDDDFQANGGGTITINGGTHTLGIAPTGDSLFGTQNGATMNLLGGSVTGVGDFVTGTGVLNIGGDASVSTASTNWTGGTVDFSSTWTGFLDSDTQSSLSDYESLITGTGATLGGVTIDAALFNSNFELNGDGALILTAVPEPTSLVVLGLGALGLVTRRRRS